jgi:hypothetical protein
MELVQMFLLSYIQVSRGEGGAREVDRGMLVGIVTLAGGVQATSGEER